MPPRRTTRATSREPGNALFAPSAPSLQPSAAQANNPDGDAAVGTLVSQGLPNLGTKITTTYGTQYAARPLTLDPSAPRDVRSAVDRAIRNAATYQDLDLLDEESQPDDQTPRHHSKGVDSQASSDPASPVPVRSRTRNQAQANRNTAPLNPPTRGNSFAPNLAPATSQNLRLSSPQSASGQLPPNQIDSSRSYGTESVVFEDATFMSTPNNRANSGANSGTAAVASKLLPGLNLGRFSQTMSSRPIHDSINVITSTEINQGIGESRLRVPRPADSAEPNQQLSHEYLRRTLAVPERQANTAAPTTLTSRATRNRSQNPSASSATAPFVVRPAVPDQADSSRTRSVTAQSALATESRFTPSETFQDNTAAASSKNHHQTLNSADKATASQSFLSQRPRQQQHQQQQPLHPEFANDFSPDQSPEATRSPSAPGFLSGKFASVKNAFAHYLSPSYVSSWTGSRAFFIAFMCLLFAISALRFLSTSSNSFSEASSHTWDSLTDKVSTFIPYSIRHPLSVFSDDDGWEFYIRMDKHGQEITELKSSSKVHEQALRKIETLMPRIIHMNLDSKGRPIISQDFWHALKAMIKEDNSILTFDETQKSGERFNLSRDDQWKAIKERFVRDATLKEKFKVSAADIEPHLDSIVSRSWEKWIRANDQRLAELLGPSLETVLGSTGSNSGSSGSQREVKAVLDKLIKKELMSGELRRMVVTRDEFIGHLKEEFTLHRHEVRAEIEELKPKINKLIQDSVRVSAEEQPPAGMSRLEIKTLVRDMVQSAMADANLEALASGRIQAHWNHELQHQVNFFGYGAGARIDPHLTTVPLSTEKDNGKHRFQPSDPSQNPSKDIYQEHPAHAALEAWQDDGDRWCGPVSRDRRGQPSGVTLSVLMSQEIIPTHLVVEHILPGATLDPDARPKEIEVWAYIDEVGLRERVKDFSAAFFPPQQGQTVAPFAGEWHVKIAQFTYETNDLGNGVHVHALSPELLAMGAITDSVAIRAISNYGANDHTCFYRVRLYGQPEAEQEKLGGL